MKLKLNWLNYPSDVSCQPLGYSKFHNNFDTNTSKPGKLLIFKPKALNFHTENFSDINISPKRIGQIFDLWESPKFKLSRNNCFYGFNSFLIGEIEYNFRYLKWFSSKMPQKLRSTFLFKLRFLKMRLLFMWLKCLLICFF